MTLIVIIIFIVVLAVGFLTLLKSYKRLVEKHNFAFEYREKFISLSNKYFETFDGWNKSGSVDSNIYMWLTKNVSTIQIDLGHLGTMHYVAPFQIYQISNYQIIINTLPKFRTGKVQLFDADSADDCLLRYLGILETAITSINKKLKNPFIWFKDGFQEIISLPIYVLNWFGIFSDSTTKKVTTNSFFKLLTGLGSLVTFVSGLVTIIQGEEQVLTFVKHLIHK